MFPAFGQKGQDILTSSKVMIIGLGALGSHTADILVRAGFGHITLVDRDIVELHNLQRQTLFDENDVDEFALKAEAAEKKLKKVNSQIKINSHTIDVNPQNIENLVSGYDLVIDGTDNFETRFLINDICMKLKIPWIYGGAVSSLGMTMNILPFKTACLRCAIDSLPSPGSTKTCDNLGIIPTIANIVASIQATEAIKILVNSGSISEELIVIDLWENRFVKIKIKRDKSCPSCSGKFEYLESRESKEFMSICGNNATQYKPTGNICLDLKTLGAKLDMLGNVKLTDKILKFKNQQDEFLVFQDGRMIIYGLKEHGRIRSTYSKYIGQ
jgi:molybdopterin-synthase adenylyltransferase